MSSQAVIAIAGKQFLVAEGDLIKLDKHVEEKVGETIVCDQVLLKIDGDKVEIGQPTLKGNTVSLEVMTLKKAPKIVTARFTAKSRHRRTVGHRQPMSELKVSKIA